MKHCIIENMARPEILKKKMSWKSSSYDIGRFDFNKEQKLQYS